MPERAPNSEARTALARGETACPGRLPILAERLLHCLAATGTSGGNDT